MSAHPELGLLEPLLAARAMRALDRWAIEERGIPSLDLMERAGFELARCVDDLAPIGTVAVVCGPGNNGGDGLVAARHLRDQGRDVRVLLAGDAAALTGDPAHNLVRLGEGRPGAPAVESFAPERLEGTAAIVDCLLGTGFTGEARGPVRAAIEAITHADRPIVVAADVPSGVDASSGEVTGPAVRATATVTFAVGKPGLWLHPGKRLAGNVRVVDIGIPHRDLGDAPEGLITAGALATIPRRGPASTKFTSGQVLVCGGAPGLSGAPGLAAEGAMRAGAGYVIVCVPEALRPVFEIRPLEAMTVGLGRTGAAEAVLERATRGALVLGPGLGRADEASELARELAARAAVPLVLDADGLNAHAGRLDDLGARTMPTVLTPHEGELGRLLGVDAADVAARRLHHARFAAREAGAIVVLKGDDTIVAAPGGRAGINAVSAPGLATAGTGDVLAGVVGAVLAGGVPPFEAACAAVRLHAVAGRLAAERVGAPEGVIASDVIACLPAARGR